MDLARSVYSRELKLSVMRHGRRGEWRQSRPAVGDQPQADRAVAGRVAGRRRSEQLSRSRANGRAATSFRVTGSGISVVTPLPSHLEDRRASELD